MALIPSESLNFPDSFRANVGWRLPDTIDQKPGDSPVGQIQTDNPFPQPVQPEGLSMPSAHPAGASPKPSFGEAKTEVATTSPANDPNPGQLELIPQTSAAAAPPTADVDALRNYLSAPGAVPAVTSGQQPNETGNAPTGTGAPNSEFVPDPPSDQQQENFVPVTSETVMAEVKPQPPLGEVLADHRQGQAPPSPQSIVAALESLSHTDIEAPIGSVEIKTPAQANHVLGLIAAAVQRGALVGEAVAESPKPPSQPEAQIVEPAEQNTASAAPISQFPSSISEPGTPIADAPANSNELVTQSSEPVAHFDEQPAETNEAAPHFEEPAAQINDTPVQMTTPKPAPVTSGFSIAPLPVIGSSADADFVVPAVPKVEHHRPAVPVRPTQSVTESLKKSAPVISAVPLPEKPSPVESVRQDPFPVQPRSEPIVAAPASIPVPTRVAPVVETNLAPVSAAPEPAKIAIPAAIEPAPQTPTSSPAPAAAPETQNAARTPVKIRIQPRKIKARPSTEPALAPAQAVVADEVPSVPQKPLTRATLEKKPGAQSAVEPKRDSPSPGRQENAEPRGELSARKIAAARQEIPQSDLFLFSARERRNRWIGFGLSELAVVTALILLGRFGFTHQFPDPTLKVLVFILLLAAAAIAVALPIAFFRNDPRRWQRAN